MLSDSAQWRAVREQWIIALLMLSAEAWRRPSRRPADAGDACAPPSQLSSALMDRAWAAAVAKLALAEVDDCEPSLLADALRHLVVAGGLAGEAPFGDVFGTPLEVCEESGDDAAAAAVRRYAGGARTSLDADDVADFALLRAAPRQRRRRRRRRRATTATGRRGRAKFFRRREACLRRREPELWRRYREWGSEAGTWHGVLA
ncbi:hypothetical protein JL722_2085 [Aureococcus anophagefferens]|nr:hypothetical protein JL722_2085 [Aureococcus anophagefferens]